MPAINATNIIRRSLKLMGAVGRGQPVQSQDAADALQALNDMISSFRTKSLTIPYEAIARYSLVPGQQTYTLGQEGDWIQPKPTFIRGIGLILLDGSSATETELPLDMMTAQSWPNVTIKAQASTFPTRVYAQFEETLVRLTFWPIPQQTNDVRIYFPAILSKFENLATDYNVQEGFPEVLVYNLARRLAPEYGLPLDKDVQELAREALANIAGPNQNMDILFVDVALRTGHAVYDWRTDSPGAGGPR